VILVIASNRVTPPKAPTFPPESVKKTLVTALRGLLTSVTLHQLSSRQRERAGEPGGYLFSTPKLWLWIRSSEHLRDTPVVRLLPHPELLSRAATRGPSLSSCFEKRRVSSTIFCKPQIRGILGSIVFVTKHAARNKPLPSFFEPH